MNKQEAYSILGLDSSVSEVEVNRAFRKLAAKYHPDKNKDPDAEATYKKISQAYQLILKPEEQPTQNFPFQHIWQHFQNSTTSKFFQYPPLYLNTEISFKESVLGCVKSVRINRHMKCDSCDAAGSISTLDSCSVCGGRGQNVTQRGNMTFVNSCGQCKGIGKNQTTCLDCAGDGTKLVEKNFDIKLPGGLNGNEVEIRLPGGGHYVSNQLLNGYSDAFLKVKIGTDSNMRLVDSNVISILEVSLLDAVQGCTKTSETVYGTCRIKIPSKSRNKDEIIEKGKGAHLSDGVIGNHIFVLDVQYPENIDNLTKLLK